ncbi:hypothetical protein L861_15415 [Litchfieldella anticariensis FP35 = DSM 16096]|uniref:Uncharacterized protein n=1 Tax=Litchfieldella anticariensis (strain DSM 16096 / CECT 5854 / CIP 108499 / LMG 22089 / FP35) TaxID=1121939 RepID=S2KGA3_LITA3|nr:hypothetical protein [Halomonas anticariensis]EPC00945.1 hypothetical protein L861_15415 [Halomonas anticariensis FP35 = DSM 16096]
MKINVEFDLTPAEFRQALGLPDVDAFQKELMSRVQQQMEAGVEGYDPMSLLQPFLQQQPFMQQPFFKDGMAKGLASFGNYQQMMLDMLRQAASASSSSEKETSQESQGRGGSSSSKRGSGSAAASSRANRKSE